MRKNTYLYLFTIQAMIVGLSSCVNQKQIAYFQKAPNQHDTIEIVKAYVPKIHSGDILSIAVGSLNPLASSFFNPYSTMPVTGDNSQISSSLLAIDAASATPSVAQSSAPGFLVDSAGTIEYPLVGNINVAGLTTSQARELIKSKLTKYLKEPTVNVRFLNYKIAIMGEVAHPSVYVIPNEQITLPEALSMAGDLTIFAKRNNILVVRDVNGKKVFGNVDLTSREVYNSPYYYLHANDLVYVQPGKGKIAQTDKTYQILPVILSALSFLAIIFEYSRIK